MGDGLFTCLQKVDLQMDIFYFLDQLDFVTLDIFSSTLSL